jgi:micrococcal nuclease
MGQGRHVARHRLLKRHLIKIMAWPLIVAGLVLSFMLSGVSAAPQIASVSNASPKASTEATTGSAPNIGEFTGRVIAVTDGDSLTVLTSDYVSVPVRLIDIDAPEPTQVYSYKSRQLLLGLTIGKQVRVVPKGKDASGRVLADVYVDATNINQAMVEQGGAWAYPADAGSFENSELASGRFSLSESRARNLVAGLWTMPADQTVAPRDFRRRRSASGAPQAVEPVIATTSSPASGRQIGGAVTSAPRQDTGVRAPTSSTSPKSRSPARKSSQAAASGAGRGGMTSMRRGRPGSSSSHSSTRTRFTSAPTSRPSSAGRCGTKRYCTQMNSCREAYFFMNSCGLYRLDGDGDGVPCESICG